MLDPIFGEIQIPVTKPPITRQSKAYPRSSKESSFATAVSTVQTNKQTSSAVSLSVFAKTCMFCNNYHPVEVCETIQNKQNNEKLDFLKSKQMCFGCLQYGHMSKSCQKHLSCKVCEQNHPTAFHMQRKENQRTPQTGTIICMATGSDTGTGKEKFALAIVPVKIKLEKGTKCITTYTFLDPGSWASFCTEELATQLCAPGKKTKILLKTMGQEKAVTTFKISGLEVAALDSEFTHSNQSL